MICSPATGGLGGDCSRMLKSRLATTSALFLIGVIAIQGASPFKKTSGNGLLHTPSNVFFPRNVGLFERADSYTHIYGSQGRDVSIRYLLDRLIICEVYAYPVGTYGSDLKSEFKIQQAAIQQINKNVRLMSQVSTHVSQNGRSIPGLHAKYQLTRSLFSGRDERCGSQLFVFRDSAWFVAYRFSHPVERADVVNNHIGDFLRQWHWKQL
jgi:hypothetical protein